MGSPLEFVGFGFCRLGSLLEFAGSWVCRWVRGFVAGFVGTPLGSPIGFVVSVFSVLISCFQCFAD